MKKILLIIISLCIICTACSNNNVSNKVTSTPKSTVCTDKEKISLSEYNSLYTKYINNEVTESDLQKNSTDVYTQLSDYVHDKNKNLECKICKIVSVDNVNNTICLNELEYILIDDKDRIRELGLTEDDFPNGEYLYDEKVQKDNYKLSNKVGVYLHIPEINNVAGTDIKTFKDNLNVDYNYYVYVNKGGTVEAIFEKYLP